jgi:hypothetical protein
MKRISTRTALIVAGIIIALLAACLAEAIAVYTLEVDKNESAAHAKDQHISSLNAQLASNTASIAVKNVQILAQNSTIENLTSQNAQLNAIVSTLNIQLASLQYQHNTSDSQVETLAAQIAALQSRISKFGADPSTTQFELQTLIFHISQKSPSDYWAQVPNVTDTYSRTVALFNGTYNVLFLPEYYGHTNWSEELAWLRNNFGGTNGVPIALDVFCGGDGASPTPQLSIADIETALACCNVKYLRISEVVSWHLEHNLPFPTDYVTSILQLCRSKGLGLVWTEWKPDNLPGIQTFTAIQRYIIGYEDIVTVSFSTNSGILEPIQGYTELCAQFQHWGASVQAWYWTTRYGGNPADMPVSVLLQHTLEARNMGAELIEFEPYWYFYNEGQPNQNMKQLQTLLS